jgi:hypothetical protein
MSGISYLLSSALMGFFVLIVAGAFLRLRNWNRPSTDSESELKPNPIRFIIPLRLIFFILLVFGISGGALIFIDHLSADLEGLTSVMILTGIFSILLVSYLLFGVYASIRAAGGSHARSLASSTLLFGFLFLILVVAQLIFS